jgi:hypothetical protein
VYTCSRVPQQGELGMNRLNNAPLRVKLLGAFTLVLVLTAGAGGFAAWQAGQLGR